MLNPILMLTAIMSEKAHQLLEAQEELLVMDQKGQDKNTQVYIDLQGFILRTEKEIEKLERDYPI